MKGISNVVLYEDKDVKITQKEVIIKFYFFPICTSKVIPISEIQKVQIRQLGWAKGRLWGMDATQWGFWLAGDLKRLSRTHFIAIYTDSSVKPSFTTEKTQTVYKIIKELVDKQHLDQSQFEMKSQKSESKSYKQKENKKL